MGRTLATTTLIAGVVYEAGTDEADIEGALAALLAAHPWEVPVIELSQAELLVR